MRHIRGDVHVLSRTRAHELAQPFAKMHLGFAVEDVHGGLDAAMQVRLRPRALGKRDDRHGDTTRADGASR